jgi:hypothetical protein
MDLEIVIRQVRLPEMTAGTNGRNRAGIGERESWQLLILRVAAIRPTAANPNRFEMN